MELSTWWWRRQGLDGSAMGFSAAEVLSKSGWARSVGGVGPYLSLNARAGLTRPGIDQAVANLLLHELPSARGCTYVVPAADFALALECARGSGHSEMATAQKLGVTTREVEQLEAAVQQALKGGPLDPAALTDACGSKARQLGEAGKKKGLNSTLPVALGRLQTEGVIRRVPVNGRLDNQRYRYTLWNLPLPARPAEEAFVELARKYFQWTGPATLAEFQWFSGLGVKKAPSSPWDWNRCRISAGSSPPIARLSKRKQNRISAWRSSVVWMRFSCCAAISPPSWIRGTRPERCLERSSYTSWAASLTSCSTPSCAAVG